LQKKLAVTQSPKAREYRERALELQDLVVKRRQSLRSRKA
jgi:hypothetical protein